MQGSQVQYWVRLDGIKGECCVLAELCALLSAILVVVEVIHYSNIILVDLVVFNNLKSSIFGFRSTKTSNLDL